MDFVALDVETANFDIGSICQIGIAKYRQGKLIDTFESLINPRCSFSQKNIDIHGITASTVNDAPNIFDIYGKILQFVGDDIVVSHTNFDQKAIITCLANANLPLPNWQWADSSVMVRSAVEKWANNGYSLANVCQAWGYQFEHHNALEDAKACGFIVNTILREKQSSIHDWIDKPLTKSVKSIKPYPNSARSKQGNTDGRFYGMAICFTGELSMSREQIANLAAKHGFDVKAGVSKKLHYLIVGTHDVSLLAGHDKSSKHRKAEDLIAQGIEIQIITERDFIKIIQM